MSPEIIDNINKIDEHPEEVEQIIARMEEATRQEANAKAAKIYKKHAKELKRLNEHAQRAVLENNFAAYKYAIEKSRDILRQPYTDELVKVQWETTRRQIWEIVNGNSKG